MKVRYIGDKYRSLQRGRVYPVLRETTRGTLVIGHPLYAESSYSDHSQFEFLGDEPMLHIAFPLLRPDEPVSWDNIKVDHEWMEDTSADALKASIRADIAKNPNSKWVIFSANTIGEVSAPPIRFRSL